MAIGAALRDRAVLIRRSSASVRDEEGGYAITEDDDAESPTFRCYFDPGNESETRDQGGIRRARSATLLVGKRFIDGSPLTLSPNDRVRVASNVHGTAVYEIVGAPQAIGKRTTGIGFLAQLQRVAP